jgi:hypothetical protein
MHSFYGGENRPAKPAFLLAPDQASSRLSFRVRLCSEPGYVPSPPSPDNRRIAENLRHTIELTELGLALRQATIEQRNVPGEGEGITQVMHEIRLAKEQAWQPSQS